MIILVRVIYGNCCEYNIFTDPKENQMQVFVIFYEIHIWSYMWWSAQWPLLLSGCAISLSVFSFGAACIRPQPATEQLVPGTGHLHGDGDDGDGDGEGDDGDGLITMLVMVMVMIVILITMLMMARVLILILTHFMLYSIIFFNLKQQLGVWERLKECWWKLRFWSLFDAYNDANNFFNHDDDEDDLTPHPVLWPLPLFLLISPMSLKMAMVEDDPPASS